MASTPSHRFVGELGFAGKFRRRRHGAGWFVDCYREDVTPRRQAMIEAANRAFDELRMPDKPEVS
jgi:hypothetical protein